MNLGEVLVEAIPSFCKFIRWAFTGRKVNRGTVLIIEDVANDALLLEMALRRLGYECELANSAEVARALIHRTYYTYIFVDLRLPGLSGEAMLRVLSEESPSAKLVIVCGEPGDLSTVPSGKPFVFIRKNVSSGGLVELFKLLSK